MYVGGFRHVFEARKRTLRLAESVKINPCYRKPAVFAAVVTFASWLGLMPVALAANTAGSPSATASGGKPISKPGDKHKSGQPGDKTPNIRTLAPHDELMKQWEPSNVKPGVAPTATPAKRPPVQSMPLKEAVELLTLDRHSTDLRQVAEHVNKLRRSITDEPANPSLRFKSGTYLYLMGDLEGAANELKTCISLQPDNAPARAQLARVLEIGGDRSQALEQYHRALELGDGIAEIHYLYADCLMHGGNVSDSINEYRRAISIKPDADSYSGLSEVLLMANDRIGAMKAARQAVSIDPSLARAQVALTNALLKNGDEVASLRTARQASLLNPNLPESHLALGRCLFTKGDITGAVDEFRQAVSLDPLNFQARNDLGYALYRQGDISSSITEFRTALRLNPHFVEAKNNLEVAVHSLYNEGKR
jgi:Flp pilus assembly protein TadD